MDQSSTSSAFYDALPRITSFENLADSACFSRLPDDWMIGAADIVGSTALIAKGQYKKVNMVGASVIASQINASGGQAFPYVFGGDGATFACGPDMAETSAEALGVAKQWAQEEFGLQLRVAQVPVSTVREAGLDVAIARYKPSAGVDYAMFSGGGLSWVESQMKAGSFSIATAPQGAVPDLTGLSCRWSNARAQNGMILSVVIRPNPDATAAAFSEINRQVITLAQRLNRAGHPLPPQGPGVQWPPPGLALEASVSRNGSRIWWRQLQLLYHSLIAWGFFKTGIKVGGFDPNHYAETLSLNADFRKFDDGLKMTLDCDEKTRAQIEALLSKARDDGILQFGLFAQEEAMTTCFVPSITEDTHIHLVDGASGGYTQAASQIKSAKD